MSNQVSHNHLKPALAFHPGEHLKDELRARNISQTDFAKIIKRSLRIVNEVIKGKRPIIKRLAIKIAAAL
jgi:HTH-type transcriptional regulator/antitoxin HigA